MREDWVECTFNELVVDPKKDFVDGPFGSNLKSEEYKQSGIPVLRIQNIKANRFINKNIIYVSEEKFEEIKRHSFISGDLIITKLGNPLGLCCRVPNDLEKGIIVADLMRIRSNNKIIESNFLLYQINSIKIQEQFKKITKGTTRSRVNLTIVRNLKLNLPPIPEQRRIFKKIETLFSSLDSSIADLKKSQDQLKIYRQAVLKKAFEGELTKEWRKRQTNLETSEEILTNLISKINTAIKNKQINKNVFFLGNKSSTININSSWNVFPLKSICKLNKQSLKRGPFGSTLKKEFFVEKGIVVYEQSHAINNTPFHHRYYISEEKFEELQGFKAGPGDLLVSCSGTLGRICLLPDNADIGVINQALLKIELNEDFINKQYFLILFRSEMFQRFLFDKSLGSAMLNMVGMNELREIGIPVPTIKEQQQIVKEIESRLSVCDDVEKQIKNSLDQAEALRQSILKKAFEGSLLTEEELKACKTEPDYESASVLLERIKADKEVHKPVKKTSKKKIS